MGAQWKQAGREINAQKKGQMVAKLVREIMVAAKLGGPDLDLNPRLAATYAEAGRFSDAQWSAQKAMVLARAAGQLVLAEQLNGEWKLYAAGLSFLQESK
jgi:transcriptional/translational regulatory protein YebC/TACO1